MCLLTDMSFLFSLSLLSLLLLLLPLPTVLRDLAVLLETLLPFQIHLRLRWVGT